MKVEIKAHANGPLVVAGRIHYRDGNGVETATGGDAVAFCRCGHSNQGLLCDGSHATASYRANGCDIVLDPAPRKS